MTRGAVLAVAAAIIAAASALAWFVPAELDRRTQLALGSRIYAERCASCHGPNLQGQPNWQTRLPNGRMPAPPHDAGGHTWHHSDSEMFAITKDGLAAIVPGYESDMPAFRGVLADAEIEATLAFIRNSWPDRESQYQRARTEADAAAKSIPAK